MEQEPVQSAPIASEPVPPQPEEAPVASTPATSPVPPPPPARRINLFVILVALLIAIICGAGGIFLGKSLNTSQKSTQPTAAPLPTQIPIPTPDITVGWKTYQVLDGRSNESIGVEYKLLPNIQPPRWINAGHYYQTVTLPGNTIIGTFLIGKNQGYQYSYDKLLDQVVAKNNLLTKPTKIGELTGIEFSGKIESPLFSQDLLILGVGENEFRGAIAEINRDRSIYLLHYQSKTVPPLQTDFISDDRLFDQILSTFRFD